MGLFNPINAKVMAGYGVILVLFLTAAGMFYQRTTAVDDKTQHLVQQTLPSLRAVEQASASFSRWL